LTILDDNITVIEDGHDAPMQNSCLFSY